MRCEMGLPIPAGSEIKLSRQVVLADYSTIIDCVFSSDKSNPQRLVLGRCCTISGCEFLNTALNAPEGKTFVSRCVFRYDTDCDRVGVEGVHG